MQANPTQTYHPFGTGKAAQARVCLYSLYSFRCYTLLNHVTTEVLEHSKSLSKHCPHAILCSVQLEDFPNSGPADWAEAILLQHSLAAAFAHGNMATWDAHNIFLMCPADYTLILLAFLACSLACCSSLIGLRLHASAYCVFSTSQCRLKVVQSSSSSPGSI